VIHTYPPLNLEVRTPRLTLAGATDELLERLVPVVRAGVADAAPWPFDDPMSLYADSPDREWRWLRAIWAGRARVDQSFWRLYFVVLLDGEPIGMEDLKGSDFTKFGTASTFSWLAPGRRGRHYLGHPLRRGRADPALAADPRRLGPESDAMTSSWLAFGSVSPRWVSSDGWPCNAAAFLRLHDRARLARWG
jgi:hypothetical protein